MQAEINAGFSPNDCAVPPEDLGLQHGVSCKLSLTLIVMLKLDYTQDRCKTRAMIPVLVSQCGSVGFGCHGMVFLCPGETSPSKL